MMIGERRLVCATLLLPSLTIFSTSSLIPLLSSSLHSLSYFVPLRSSNDPGLTHFVEMYQQLACAPLNLVNAQLYPDTILQRPSSMLGLTRSIEQFD